VVSEHITIAVTGVMAVAVAAVEGDELVVGVIVLGGGGGDAGEEGVSAAFVSALLPFLEILPPGKGILQM